MWIVQLLENSCILFWKVRAVVDSHIQAAELAASLIISYHSSRCPPSHTHLNTGKSKNVFSAALGSNCCV